MISHIRISTPFGRETTAEQVIAGVDLTGRRAVVTGGASGIGAETARALAAAGAEVTLAVCDVEAGKRTAAEITAKTGNNGVVVAALELTKRDSIAAFAAGWQGPLHILINNARVMAVPELSRTAEGWELHFAKNHLGHFALAVGLHGALSAAGNARVVSVSSNAHRRSPVVFGDIHFMRRKYDPCAAYGQSKTANVLFAVEACRRWAVHGITANALMSREIRTNPRRDQETAEIQPISNGYPGKTVEQGAATSVLLAVSPLLEGVGGRYFEDCKEAAVTTDPDAEEGVRPHALDPGAAARLWDVSMAMLAS